MADNPKGNQSPDDLLRLDWYNWYYAFIRFRFGDAHHLTPVPGYFSGEVLWLNFKTQQVEWMDVNTYLKHQSFGELICINPNPDTEKYPDEYIATVRYIV